MDTTKESPTVLSLCTGYGGLEIGLERVFGKINVLVNVEIESFPIANLVNKMETGQMAPTPIWTDLKTFNAKIFRGFVDILTGGYPCQPFSHAGRRKGEEDPRHLWPYITKIIEDCEPRWVFFENVEGHLSNGIVQVLRDLEWLGYKPKTGIFSATEVGAPHQRKRVFILGQRIVVNSDSRRLEGSKKRKRSASINVKRSNSGQEALGNSKHDGLDEPKRKTIRQGKEGGLQESQGRCEQGLADTVLRRYFYEKEKIRSRGLCVVDESERRGNSDRQVADSEHDGLSSSERKRRGMEQQEGWQKESQSGGQSQTSGDGKDLHEGKLVNSEHDGWDGFTESGSIETSGRNNTEGEKKTSKFKGTGRPGVVRHLWPARPGEEQYPWEEPRVLANTPGRRFEQCESSGEAENDVGEEGKGKKVADTDISQSRWKNVKKPGKTSLAGLGSDGGSGGKLAESDESGTCGWSEDRTLPENRGNEIQPNRLRKTTKADVSRNSDSRGYEEKLVDSEAEGFQGCGESYSEERGKHQGERREVVGGATKSGTYGRPSGGEETSSKTQPKLGRAIDGVADRVDRLRLLGNGVVPQVAEKAFRVLLEETQQKDNEDLMDDWFV